MPPSYHKINYALRPAKSAQRKMIVEACGHLRLLLGLRAFRYIGLGSPFFNDFSTLHRQYGIRNMVCIERETADRDRFVFNRPYDCIEMQWGSTNEVLPTLSWKNTPTIIWMDYDQAIDPSMLSDLSTVFANIHPFGLVLVTIESQGVSPPSQSRSALIELRKTLGNAIPADVRAKDMVGKKFQMLIRRIVDNEIRVVLSQRNATAEDSDVVLYEQFFNFSYRDSVSMTTIGGLVYP